jgi:hypothetical protein
MKNHFTESGEATFFKLPATLVHFRKPFHGISKELILFEKLFNTALAGFNRESTLVTPPNRA